MKIEDVLVGPNSVCLWSVQPYEETGEVGGYNENDTTRAQNPTDFIHQVDGFQNVLDYVHHGDHVEGFRLKRGPLKRARTNGAPSMLSGISGSEFRGFHTRRIPSRRLCFLQHRPHRASHVQMARMMGQVNVPADGLDVRA